MKVYADTNGSRILPGAAARALRASGINPDGRANADIYVFANTKAEAAKVSGVPEWELAVGRGLIPFALSEAGLSGTYVVRKMEVVDVALSRVIGRLVSVGVSPNFTYQFIPGGDPA